MNTLLIVGNYLLQPHNANITQDAALYSSETVQTVSLLARPIALQLVLAVVAYLWVRGAEEAIRRADLAEEIVALQRREQTRTFALQEGVRYLQQALSAWVIGDVRHRIPAMPDPVLEQVREDLNLFIDRFGPDRQASFALYRLQEEARRLTMALEDWLSGRPVVWPAPSGTELDRAMELLRMSRSRPPSSSRPSLGPNFSHHMRRKVQTYSRINTAEGSREAQDRTHLLLIGCDRASSAGGDKMPMQNIQQIKIREQKRLQSGPSPGEAGNERGRRDT